jgi:hypothetical protein
LSLNIDRNNWVRHFSRFLRSGLPDSQQFGTPLLRGPEVALHLENFPLVDSYDGDCKRVKKSNGTLYWMGPRWDPLLETDLSGNAKAEYVFNGERVARVDMPANTVEYYFSDHLKSTDIVTDHLGGIVRESDYVMAARS